MIHSVTKVSNLDVILKSSLSHVLPQTPKSRMIELWFLSLAELQN